jgi:hypothetical protein
MDQRLCSFDSSRDEAEVMRKKFRYRQLILSGKIFLSHERAAQLLGPDCLYHLYSVKETNTTSSQKKKFKRHYR